MLQQDLKKNKECIPVFNKKEFHLGIQLQYSKVKNTGKLQHLSA